MAIIFTHDQEQVKIFSQKFPILGIKIQRGRCIFSFSEFLFISNLESRSQDIVIFGILYQTRLFFVKIP